MWIGSSLPGPSARGWTVCRRGNGGSFIQRYWYGDPVKKLAQEVGEQANTIAQRLLRLRKGLRAFLESEGVEI